MIPKEFVRRYTETAQGFRFFGTSLEDMTREELIACAVSGWEELRRQSEEHKRRLEFLSGLRDRKGR